MGLFRRRKPDDLPPAPPEDPHPTLPMLSRDDAVLLDRLAREAFAERGVEVTTDGAGQLTAMDGRGYGLSNLAARVATEPRSAWPGMVTAHVEGLLASDDVPLPQTLDEVRGQVYPRLRWAADLPERPSYADEVLPGVLVLLAIDYPTHVAELFGDDAVETLGGWPAVRSQAMANLRALEPMHHQVIRADDERDDAEVHVLTSDDFFGPSRLLVLDEVVAGLGIERPAHGTLVVVPNRHLLALHPLAGVGVVSALQLLARIGTGECESQPGALSPHVYYLSPGGGPGQQVTRTDDDGTLVVEVRDGLAEGFAALGLIGE